MSVQALKVENNPDLVAVTEDAWETYRLIALDEYESYIEDQEEQRDSIVPVDDATKETIRNSPRFTTDDDGNIIPDSDYDPEVKIANMDKSRVKNKEPFNAIIPPMRSNLDDWRAL